MCNMILCAAAAVALLFTAAQVNGAEKKPNLKYPWDSSHTEAGKNLVYDQIGGWDPEIVAVATEDKFSREVVSDGPSGRVRRAAQIPQMPEFPQPPQGMPEIPQPPQGIPTPSGIPGMPS